MNLNNTVQNKEYGGPELQITTANQKTQRKNRNDKYIKQT